MCQWNFVSAILWKINNGKLENKKYGTWAGEGWEVPTVECPNQCYVKLGDKVLESTSADTEGTEIKLKDIETPPTKKQQIETDINSKKKENPASTPYPFVIFMYVRDRQLFHLIFFPTPISLLLHQHQKYHLG